MMDRWEISLSDVLNTEQQGDPMPYNIINNYFSVGVVRFPDKNFPQLSAIAFLL